MAKVKEKSGTKYYAIKNFPSKGVRFIDFTPTLLDSRSFRITVAKLYRLADSIDFDYIVAPESRGFIWSSALAQRFGVPLITVRKKGKLPPSVVGYGIEYETEYSTDYLEIPDVKLNGMKVLFVDDVYATGGTYGVCSELVEQSGGELVGGVVVYDVGINKNAEIKSLYNGDDL